MLGLVVSGVTNGGILSSGEGIGYDVVLTRDMPDFEPVHHGFEFEVQDPRVRNYFQILFVPKNSQ